MVVDGSCVVHRHGSGLVVNVSAVALRCKQAVAFHGGGRGLVVGGGGEVGV